MSTDHASAARAGRRPATERRDRSIARSPSSAAAATAWRCSATCCSSMAAQQGLYGMMVQSYGPQIRGGESAVVLRLSRERGAVRGRRGRRAAVLPHRATCSASRARSACTRRAR